MGDEPVVGQRPVVQSNVHATPPAAAQPDAAGGRVRDGEPLLRAIDAFLRLAPGVRNTGFNRAAVRAALLEEFQRNGCLTERAFERIFFNNRTNITHAAWRAFVGRDNGEAIASPRDLAACLEQFEDFQGVIGSGLTLESFFDCHRITVVPFDQMTDYMASLDQPQVARLVRNLSADSLESFCRYMGISLPPRGQRRGTEELYRALEREVLLALTQARLPGSRGAHNRRMLGMLGLAFLNNYDSACVDSRIRMNRMGLSDPLAFQAFWFGRDGQDGFLAYLVGPELAARSRGNQTVIAPTGAAGEPAPALQEPAAGEAETTPTQGERLESDVTRADYRAICHYSGRIAGLRDYVRDHNLRLTVRLDDLDTSSPDFEEILAAVEAGISPDRVATLINNADRFSLRQPELPSDDPKLAATPANGVQVQVLTDEEREARVAAAAPVVVGAGVGGPNIDLNL